MQRWIVVALVAMFAVPMAAAFANPDVFVFTERGNKFKIEEERENQGGDLTGCQDGYIHLVENGDVVIVDGEGICVPGSEVPDPDADEALDSLVSSIYTNSRLTDRERPGKMSIVEAGNNYEQSLFPYLGYGDNAEWAAAIYDDTTPHVITIPTVYRDYTFKADKNFREQTYRDSEIAPRITEIGNIEDRASSSYRVESHGIRGDGVVFIKVPSEADGAIVTYNSAAGGNVRLAQLDRPVLELYDFKEIMPRQDPLPVSFERNFVARVENSWMNFNPVQDPFIPAHHHGNWNDFSLAIKVSGTTNLALCTSEGVKYGYVEQTVEIQKEPWDWSESGGTYRVWGFDMGYTGTDEKKKARQDIRDEFNTINGEIYEGDQELVRPLSDSLEYDGVLTFCKGGAVYFIHKGVQHSSQTVVLSYKVTPMVLNSNGEPVGTLQGILNDFTLIPSNTRLSGVTENTFLVVTANSGTAQLKIKYDARPGYTSTDTYVADSFVGVTDYRTFGNATMSHHSGHIEVGGHGRAIIQLDNTDADVLANGMRTDAHLADGTTMQIIKSPYDLTNLQYVAGQGFNLNGFSYPIIIGDHSSKITQTYTRYVDVRAFHVPLQSSTAGAHTHDREVSATVRACININYGSNGEYKTVESIDRHELYDRCKLKHPDADYERDWIISVWKHWEKSGWKRIDDRGTRNFQNHVYDELPGKIKSDILRDRVDTHVAIPAEDNAFLVIDSNGGSSTIDLTVTPQTSMRISGLPVGIPYFIERGEVGISSGVTKSIIDVELDLFSSLGGAGAKIYLYPDALIGPLDNERGVVFFDSKNEKTQSFDRPNSQYLYSVHTYVKLPQFTTPMEIVSMNLTSTVDEFGEWDEIPMDYLLGEYQQFSDVYIPVIPGFQEVHLTVKAIKENSTDSGTAGASEKTKENTRKIKMRIEDVPKDTNVKVIPAQHSNGARFSNELVNTRASASSTISFVAKETGTASVVIDTPVSGETSFTIHDRTIYKVKLDRFHSCTGWNVQQCRDRGHPPGPPDPTHTRWEAKNVFRNDIRSAITSGGLTSMDVLVHVIINGELAKTETLFTPDQITITGSSGYRAAHAVFETEKIYNAVEFDARAGDFVEVVIDTHVQADGYTGSAIHTDSRDGKKVYHNGKKSWKQGYAGQIVVQKYIQSSAAFSSASVSIGPGVMFFAD